MSPLENNAAPVSHERQQLERAGTLHWFHWVIVGLSLLLTFGAWYFAQSQLEEKTKLQFERQADQAVDLIVERMGKYEDALWSGVGIIQSTGGDIDYPPWVTFAKSLRIEERYPGINGIGVIHRVTPNQLDAYLSDQRRFRPDYTIHPTHQENEYWPISYIIPVGPNEKAIGLDMAHETNRLTASKKSRDTGAAQITGPITLVQDAGKTPGFLFFAPFYRGGRYESLEDRQHHFVGMVYAPFVVNKLMEGVLAKQNRQVGIRMTDQADMLYDEHVETETDFDPNPLFSKAITIPLYGRLWKFDIRSTQSFRAAASNRQPLTILIGGLVIDGLLLALFIFISKGSRKALAYADRSNQDLQHKTAHLTKTNKDLEQFSFLVSHDLKAPLRGIKTLVGFVEDDAKDQFDQNTQRHLQQIAGFVTRIEMLLKDLLIYSSFVKPDQMPKTTCVRLPKIIDDICDLNEINREAISCQFDLPELWGPEIMLKTALNNLILNAFHHGTSGTGETPSVQVRCRKINEHQIEFSVRDHGPGIPKNKEETVFEMFKQLGRTNDHGGTGVGMAIVKRIVLNTGQQVWIEHPEGGGVKVLFTWPYQIPIYESLEAHS